MKKAVFTIASLCAALGINAQSLLGLSYPLGVPDLAVTGAAAALGGGGTALAEEQLGTSLNPANAAIGERSAFSAMVSFDVVNISDADSSSTVSGYMPKLLSLIVPIGKAGNVGFSMQRRYDANLNFYTRERRVADERDPIASSTSTIELHRSGGLTAWQAGWAYRFANGVSAGLQYERFYFKRDSREVFESVLKYDLDDGDEDSYTSSTTETKTAYAASDAFRIGMQVPVHEKVTLGFAVEYALPGKANGSATRSYRGTDILEPSDTSYSYSVTLPPYMNMGAAYKLDERWLFTADAYFTMWELYKSDYEPDAAKVDRCLGMSIGARFIPAVNVLSSKYWEKIHYSAGFSYAALPNDDTQHRASEFALSLGAGLPIPNDGGSVDFALSFGRRSDPKYSGYGENTVKLLLGVNGGRNWFQKDASKNY